MQADLRRTLSTRAELEDLSELEAAAEEGGTATRPEWVRAEVCSVVMRQQDLQDVPTPRGGRRSYRHDPYDGMPLPPGHPGMMMRRGSMLSDSGSEFDEFEEMERMMAMREPPRGPPRPGACFSIVLCCFCAKSDRFASAGHAGASSR